MNNSVNHQLLARWKNSMEEFLISDIRSSLGRDFLEVGLIVLTMVGIDCLGGYFAGKPSDQSTFRKFVASDYFPLPYHALVSDLYELRNGLIHDFTIKGDRFEFTRKEFDANGNRADHLRVRETETGKTILLNREIFAKDFLRAWETFAVAAFQDEHLAAVVCQRIRDEPTRAFLVIRPDPTFPETGNPQSNRGERYQEGTAGWREQN